MNLLSDRRFRIHFLVWCVLLTLLFVLNRNRYDDLEALVVTSINGAVLSSFFYANYSWASRFYLTKKYALYFSLIALMLCLGVFIMNETQRAIPPSFEQRFRNALREETPAFRASPESPRQFGRRPDAREPGAPRRRAQFPVSFRLVPISFLMLVTWALSALARTGDQAREKEKEVALLQAEKSDTELKLLKSQINPHFLFNALNNIYSLTVTKSDHAPDLLLKLSSMLRYVLYEGNDNRVPLASEIKYIEDYITLQKLKDDEISNIEFTNEGDIDYFIPPMLLIPFVENAFKHSKVEDLVNGWIKINLQVKDTKQLIFSVENSLPSELETDKTGGIGIDNVRRRLELLYGDNCTLEITDTNDSFHVHLNIPLN